MNVCTFSGRITKDATEFVARNGTSIANFTIAIDCGYGDNKKTLFLNCKMFKRGGMVQHLTKGKAFIVSGELCPNDYTDKSGNQVRTMELIVGHIDFQLGDSGQQRTTQRMQQAPQQTNPFPSEADELDPIPF